MHSLIVFEFQNQSRQIVVSVCAYICLRDRHTVLKILSSILSDKMLTFKDQIFCTLLVLVFVSLTYNVVV